MQVEVKIHAFPISIVEEMVNFIRFISGKRRPQSPSDYNLSGFQKGLDAAAKRDLSAAVFTPLISYSND